MGIVLGSNFDVQTALPLDSRTVVADLTARDAINSLQRYQGLIVYVVDIQKNFQLIGGITNFDWQELSGSGGGGVGGGLSWRGLPGSEPFFKDYAKYRMHEFASGGNQAGIASFKVPDSYIVGGEIKLLVRVTAEVSSLNNLSVLLTSGVLDNSDITTPITGTDTQDLLGWNANEIYDLEFSITDGSGEIGGSPVQPGNIISLELMRVNAALNEATESVMFMIDHMEVLFL